MRDPKAWFCLTIGKLIYPYLFCKHDISFHKGKHWIDIYSGDEWIGFTDANSKGSEASSMAVAHCMAYYRCVQQLLAK